METVASAAHPRITIDPNICHGQPTVRGLRYPVQNVLEYLASGMTEAEILADYEDLEAEDLRACQAYAAQFYYMFEGYEIDFGKLNLSWLHSVSIELDEIAELVSFP